MKYDSDILNDKIIDKFQEYDEFVNFCKTHTNKEITECLGFNYEQIKRFCKEKDIDIKKSKKDNQVIHNRILVEKYGSLEEAYKKQKETRMASLLNKYGVDNIMKLPEKQLQRKKTLVEKYEGLENYSTYWKDKMLATQELKYGSIKDAYEHQQQARDRTMQERYGVVSYTTADDFQSKRKATLLSKYGSIDNYYQVMTSKIKSTKLKRYGDENYHNIEKMKETNLLRYGVEYNFASSDENLNGRSNFSKLESRWLNYYVELYGQNDVISHYYDDRYYNLDNGHIFQCDIYVISQDLFIEIHGYPSHGDRLFDSESEEDILSLEKLLEDSNFVVANTWAYYDNLRIEIAKLNKLNLLVIYPYSKIYYLWKEGILSKEKEYLNYGPDYKE